MMKKPRVRKSAYGWFVYEVRMLHRIKHPNDKLKINHLNRLCSKPWQDLCTEDKKMYQILADKAIIRYNAQMVKYNQMRARGQRKLQRFLNTKRALTYPQLLTEAGMIDPKTIDEPTEEGQVLASYLTPTQLAQRQVNELRAEMYPIPPSFEDVLDSPASPGLSEGPSFDFLDCVEL